jgi:hypothetical protein
MVMKLEAFSPMGPSAEFWGTYKEFEPDFVVNSFPWPTEELVLHFRRLSRRSRDLLNFTFALFT